MTTLPAPRDAGAAYEVAMVCLGNICRSPMASTVLGTLVDRAGLTPRVGVRSCGTGGWHVGEPMDVRAASTLLAADYDPTGHRARQLDAGWLDADLVLAMDEQNLADVRDLARRSGRDPEETAQRVLLLRDFDPLGPGAVPDPYYGGPDGFDDVLAMVERTCLAVVAQLERMLARR